MIIGNGDIANVLNDRMDACFFASGVSNSACINKNEFEREKKLLLEQIKTNKCLVYFSSISVETKKTPYFSHKKIMEQTIRENFKFYLIIRIGNIDWGDNPNTFLNFLKSSKKNGDSINVFQENRYLISKKQLLLITDNMPLNGQNEINVFGKMVWLPDLFKQL